ncbi:MAG: inositol monophosphatase family protein [Gammaproteobacteria bacterium]
MSTALLNIGVKAARQAGNVIVRGMNKLDSLTIETKGKNDYASEIDQNAELAVIETVRAVHPDHAFLGEETGQSGTGDVVWIIDPLDGTTNYLHGFPQFCVSIAVEVKGRLVAGVVYDPLRQELFTASRGDGAQLDGKRIRVTQCNGLPGSLIGTGFPYRSIEVWGDLYWDMLKDVSAQASGIRRPGAAALDMAYVAAGRLDGFWEIGLKPWDTAAGELLVREAGGLVSDLVGGEQHRELEHICAGGARVFRDLLKTVSPHARKLQTSASS